MGATALRGSKTHQVALTRIIRPQSGPQLINRERLLARLDAAAQLPLTVVTGPPGSGKTSLLSNWAAQSTAPVAWVSLDPEDADPARFWAAAFGAIAAAGADGLADDLRALSSDRADFLAGLGNRLEDADAGLRIVLDDFQEVQGSGVAEDIDALLRHPPGGLRLIIASRADPVLSLHRLRMAGQLSELRGADLAFTDPEAAELFSRAGIELQEDQVGALVRQTEGWAGGLRLAALSLSGQPGAAEFIQDFAGDERAVSQYLIEQALDNQPDEMRDFMLRISIVDSVTSDLADAVTGNADGAQILERLARGNVFLSRHDQPHGWFRYHRMFGELLRAQLRHRHPALVTLGHRRAAHWYARNDLPALAARHALAADDPELAARALCRGWLKLLLEGRPAAMTSLINALPESLVARNPELATAAAALLFESGRPHEARGFLVLGERAASHVEPQRRAHWLLSRTVAQVQDARSRGDFEAVAAGAGKLLSGLGADASELGAAGRRTFALLRFGVAQTWLGELEAARTSLEEALALALHGSREYLAGNALAALAVLHVRTGDLRRARESGARALSICERHNWSDRRAGRDARFALATCAHHQGRGAEARRHLDALAAAAPLEPALGAAVRILGARVSLREGEPEAARIALASLRRQSIEPTARAMWFLGLAQTEADALCALGSGEEAQAAVASDPGATALDGKLVASRLALAAGHPELVTSVEPAPGDDAAQNVGAQIELRALAAVAHHQRGDDDSALALTERALELAEPDGRVEPFLAVGRPIRELLSRRIRAGTAHRSLAGTVIEQLDPRPATPTGEARTLLLEPLSERELAVLRYLPTPLSKAEIAAEMFVTVNTVKTHVKSIYRKLDVGSRVEAVRRARTLALI